MASGKQTGGGQKVDLSHGDAEQLQRIEGIDGARARLILEYRSKHGAFQSWDDFEAVVGIGPTLMEKAKGSAVLGGAEGRGGGRGSARGGERRAGRPARGDSAPATAGAKGVEEAEEVEGAEEEDLDLTPEEVLMSLARLDVEAALAYEAAAELAGDPDVERQIRAFGQDHRRHVEETNRVLESVGEPAVTEPPDPHEGVLAGIARLAGPLGPTSLALALLANEQLTNLSYEDALAYEWDDEIERMLERFRGDEERHMKWLSEHHEKLEAARPPEQPETQH